MRVMSELPFRFGAVTDELDDDLERGLRIARDLGIDTVELNQIWGRSIVELEDTEIAQVRRLVTEASHVVGTTGAADAVVCAAANVATSIARCARLYTRRM